MAGAKVVVIYPRPTDESEFERQYKDEHLPMLDKLKGMSRFVASRVLESPQGKVTAYRIAEVHFPSMEQLKACLETDDAKQVVEHAKSISTGGEPLVLVCDEESRVYW